MNARVGWIVGVLALSLPSGVLAHLDMTSPVSRYGAEVLKDGPCGVAGGVRSANISYFEPGETIELVWNEYVDHPSHYRVAFDADGDDDFVDPATMDELYSNEAVLLDGIEDHDEGEPTYRVQVELPNVECDRCTLQLIQVMYDKPPYQVGSNDIYYQCADLVLKEGGGDADAGTETDPDAGTDTDAGTDAGTGTGTGTGTGDDTFTGEGCAASIGDPAGAFAWLLVLLAIRRLARTRGLPV